MKVTIDENAGLEDVNKKIQRMLGTNSTWV